MNSFIDFGLSEDDFNQLCGVEPFSRRPESVGPPSSRPFATAEVEPTTEFFNATELPDVAGTSGPFNTAELSEVRPSTKSSLVCPTCAKTFTRKDNLTAHLKTHTGEKSYACDVCQKTFARNSNLSRHMKTHLGRQCPHCSMSFSLKVELNQHLRVSHPKRKPETTPAPRPKKVKKTDAVLGVFTTHTITPTEEASEDLIKFFEEMRPTLKTKLFEELEEKQAVKWYADVRVILTRTTREGDLDSITPHFRSKCLIELVSHTIQEHVEEAFAKITKSFDEFTQRGSGWTLEKITLLELCVAKYQPLAASSYIPLPKKLADKKAVLNIQNEDQKCFVWCLLAHQMNIPRSDNANRVAHYTPFEDTILLGDVTCPVPLNRISKVEDLNNLRINVFGYEEEVFPLYISPRQDEDVVNLLLISNEERSHYCLIRNFSRLLGDLTQHKCAHYYCYRCLHRFSREDLLKEHLTYCNEHSPQHIKMPKEGENIIKFANVHFQHPIPYVIYADFEALVKKMDGAQGTELPCTHPIAQHEACGYAYIIIGPDGKSHKPVTVYRGPNAIHHFIENIIREKDELAEILTNIVPIIMSPQDELDFKNATHCTICKKWLGGDRVRDHCHTSGRYRSALHGICNALYRMQKKIPVIFHNLKHYDGHLIMQKAGLIKDHEISVVPTTIEKYISFSLSKKHNKCRVSLNFLDSFQFMATSLQKLVENLSSDQFSLLKENVPHHIDLLLRKGVYPYEYMDSFIKFEETSLPPPIAFSSTLTGEEISQEDYLHAQNVWRSFNLDNMGDYHDLYVKSDVLQLADVFQNFRNLCKNYYGLDCAHLMTAPGLAWQGCLKMVEQPLELFTDINMHLFVESGIRGGISVITKRWAQANNKYMEMHDSQKASNYIMYLDANNLYGWAMSQPLPYGGFQWFPTDGITSDWILTIPESGPVGYIFEVDLEYPPELHDLHNDYPLAPEKMKINIEDLSPFSKSMLRDGKYIPCEKLTPNLKNKTNYTVHFRNLQLYLKQGLKLIKVHRMLKFDQKPWLKTYIDFNTQQRKNAKSSFEKDFFKLMNNSVYGKTMENIRNRRDVLLVSTEQKAKKLVSAPTFKRFKAFDEELVGVERLKKTLTLNKPIYVGFTILELSKVLMYNYHYNVIKAYYSERACLLFTDTDSLTYEIRTDDFYRDMTAHGAIYDTSDYPEDHPLYSIDNKKKIGCFKDELNSKPVLEFVGLRAKMYSILSEQGEKKTAKGVARCVVRNKMRHHHYKTCLDSLSPTREIQHRIQSSGHHLFTTRCNKIALSAFDDKRYILDDGVLTLAHGHYRIT